MDNRTSGIRHRADGSIDIEHYTARGRIARSRQAMSLFALLWRRRPTPDVPHRG